MYKSPNGISINSKYEKHLSSILETVDMQFYILHLLLAIVSFLFSPCAASASPSSKAENSNLTYITLEEHYDSPSVRSYQRKDAVYDLLIDALGTSLQPSLHNISIRIPNMNANNIKMQVVANNPQPYALGLPNITRQANNELAQTIVEYPDRFRGFCFLPMAQPAAAAQELERCVSSLGFLGALVDSHLLNNTFYDGPEYDILWSTFERLDVPFYMHPTYPPISQVNHTGGLYTPDHNSYSDPLASVFGTAGWGWHSDTGLAFVRMWFSGVFDRHSKLKIVLGHMGDILPYMLARVDLLLGAAKGGGLSCQEAYAQNAWVTTSGSFSLVPFQTLWAATAPDRIMVGPD